MKKTSLVALLVGLFSIGPVYAGPFSISMVADNDFAIFSGTASSINNILYQNNTSWPNQIIALSTLTFNLAAGDNRFYVLGMGGGGPEENISGTVNGVNMTNPSVTVLMSSNLAPSLSNYNVGGNVAAGNYNALLSDVQSAFSGLTWGSPTLNSSQTVIQQAGFGSGFIFSTLRAHLFAFEATEVNVSVPEPSVLVILGIGLLGLALQPGRRKFLI